MISRATAKFKKAKAVEDEARRKAWEIENRRISTQRALFAHLENCPAKDRLLKMMEDRAIWLLDNCRNEEADAILEFMPDDAVTALLDEYFCEAENDSLIERSKIVSEKRGL